MLMHPNIDPVAFHLGPLSVHWYGIMYLLSFIGVWGLAMLRRGKHSGWSSEQIGDLIFYGALGVIIGGRLGYMLFYDFSTLIHEPWVALKIWQGGMSFHGGLLGVCIAMMIFAWKMEKPLFVVTDFIAPLVPFGLAMGRMGNFINGELWGRETTVPWGMVFPMAGDAPRHPSQLYEFFLEGFVLFIALWFYSARPRAMGSVSAWFLIGYALARITAECFRQPDLQLGFVAYNWLTMGQILSIPMLLAGIFLLFWSKKNAAVPPTHENNFNGRAS